MLRRNAYSQLNAYKSDVAWSTQSFPISQGVFQGDTMHEMSPIIFLLPIIQLTGRCPGFFFKIPIADTEHLLSPGTSI